VGERGFELECEECDDEGTDLESDCCVSPSRVDVWVGVVNTSWCSVGKGDEEEEDSVPTWPPIYLGQVPARVWEIGVLGSPNIARSDRRRFETGGACVSMSVGWLRCVLMCRRLVSKVIYGSR
jgi:hypothetical protein